MPTKGLLGQPKPFYLIFFLEVWERYGFYGVQGLLVLFLVLNLNYSDAHADKLFGSFAALAFLYPVIGGYIGDHLLGTKRTIIIGAFILAAGYLLLSIPFFSSRALIELPLAFIAVGNGFFKANPSSLLSKVYQKEKVNQDAGFTLYYMAINIGSFLSFIIAPLLNKYFGWHAAFLSCFIGLLLAITNYLSMSRIVRDVGSDPDFKPMRWGVFFLVMIFGLALIAVSFWLLDHIEVMTTVLLVSAVVLLSFYFLQVSKASKQEKRGMIFFVFLFLQAIVFFVMYFQMPTSINLFALYNVRHDIFGIPVQTATFQVLNPFWIIIMSPVLSAFYNWLSKHNCDISLPTKFSLGTLLAGIAFLILWVGAYSSKGTGVLSSYWVVTSYWFQSTGELLVSALGLSLASRFVPQRLMGYAMGLWFLSFSLASIVAGHVAAMAHVPKTVSRNPLETLPIFGHVFMKIGLITVVISLVMFFFVPMLKRLVRSTAAF